MSRAVTHPFKPKIEPKEEMDVDDENDREDQKENIDLDVKANNVGGGLPGAFPALPAPLPGFAAAPAAGGFRADPLFQPGLFARPAPAVQAAGDVPIIDYHAQLQALRARQAAVAAAAAAARTADIVPKAGPSNRPAGADPEQTLRNADDDPGSSDDEEHRTRVEEILAGGGGPVEQKSVWCAWRIEIGPCTDTDTFQPIGCVLPGQCWRTRLQRRWHGSYGDRPKLSWAQRTQRSAAKVCLSFFWHRHVKQLMDLSIAALLSACIPIRCWESVGCWHRRNHDTRADFWQMRCEFSHLFWTSISEAERALYNK